MAWADWCPLCGRRFQAETVEEICNQIIEHIDDGSCEKNWRPLEIALADDCYDYFRKEE